MMDETRTRFLAAIAKQLPAERIAEAHLFAAIRQGGVESGVAVIALEQEVVEELPQEVGEEDLATETAEAQAAEDVVEALAGEVGDATDVEAIIDAVDASTEDRATDGGDDSPYAADDDVAPVAVAAPVRPRRYVVCTARYRHTLKGPDRGKWEVTVTEEADAPLLAVDAVVRGVQRRSGDVDEIVRLSGDELRAALPASATP
jgi:hypothetical protein